MNKTKYYNGDYDLMTIELRTVYNLVLMVAMSLIVMVLFIIQVASMSTHLAPIIQSYPILVSQSFISVLSHVLSQHDPYFNHQRLKQLSNRNAFKESICQMVKTEIDTHLEPKAGTRTNCWTSTFQLNVLINVLIPIIMILYYSSMNSNVHQYTSMNKIALTFIIVINLI
ncbi:hypothetical protein BLOT_000193 [Blomia tropicalis]|nr:hypothetical protein BLOT_000193 [Blomia tropicalis]